MEPNKNKKSSKWNIFKKIRSKSKKGGKGQEKNVEKASTNQVLDIMEDIKLTHPVLFEHQQDLISRMEIDDEEFHRNLLDCLDGFQVTVLKSETTEIGSRKQLLKALQQNIDAEETVQRDPNTKQLIVKFIECLGKCRDVSNNYVLSLMLRQTYDKLSQ
jgi:hypothetical protein